MEVVDERRSCPLEKKIEDLGIGLFHYRLVVILGLGNAADAVEVLSLGYLLTVFQSIHEGNALLNSWQQSCLTAGVFFGMLFGGITLGMLSDRLGRRTSFLYALVFNVIGAFGVAISWSINSMIAFRIVAGFGVGGSVPSLFTLCVEHLPKRNRGFFVTCVAAFWMVGSIFTAGIAWLMLSDTSNAYWRTYACITSLPSAICLICSYFYIPESARFLSTTGRTHEALLVIEKIGRVNGGVERELLIPTARDLKFEAKERMVIPPPYVCLPYSTQFRMLFSKTVISSTLLLGACWLFLSYASYGLSTWITTVFKTIGFKSPFQNSFMFAVATLPGNLASAYMVDIVGRKWVFSVSAAAAGACAMAFAIESNSRDAFLIILFSCSFNAFSIACWNALDILTAESFPTTIRTTSAGFLTALGRLGSMSAQFVNGYLMDPNDPRVGTVLVVVSLIMYMCASCAFFVKETNGLALKD